MVVSSPTWTGFMAPLLSLRRPLLTDEKRKYQAYGAKYQINETLMATVTSLATTGRRFYKDRKMGEKDLSSFFDKDKERSRVTKMADGSYNRKDLMAPWVDMAEFIMRYITLDGRYASLFSYHFTILNHFRHGKLIFVPYYLASSPENSLEKHLEKPSNPILHEGLIILIMEHAESLEIVPPPAEFGLQTKVQDVSDLEMDLDDSGVPVDDPEYEPADVMENMVTPEMLENKNPPRWASSKYKTNNKLISKAEPLTKTKKLAMKDHSPKIMDQGIKLDIPINVHKDK